MFKTNKIISESEAAATILKEARENKKITLAEAAQETEINIKYLQALESGQYQKLPQGVYGKNFLREYANFLGVNYQDLLSMLAGKAEGFKVNQQQDVFSQKVVSKKHLIIWPRLLRSFLIGLIILICFVYLGRSFYKIFSPPYLEIIEPINNLVTSDINIKIVGKTEPETSVTINGETILADSQGNFSQPVDLKSGINNIIIIARKKYGQEQKVERQILVK